MNPDRRAQRGFTLVEVLVAVVVLGLAAVALSNAFGGSIRGHSRMEDRTDAWLLASNKLVELQVYTQYPKTGVQDETQEVEGRTWRVRTRVSEGPYPDTRRVDIEVGPEQDDAQDFYIVYTESSLLGKPFANQGLNPGNNPGGGTGTGSGPGAGGAPGGGSAGGGNP